MGGRIPRNAAGFRFSEDDMESDLLWVGAESAASTGVGV